MATETVTLRVAGMTCGHCAKTVERHVQMVPGVLAASVNLGAGTLRASVDPARVALRDVEAAVEEAGYEPRSEGA